MIVVTGANGHLGALIVDELLKLQPPTTIGVSVRDPGKAEALAARGVRVRRGDFGDPTSLDHAFEGATQLLLVSSNARASGGDAIAQHRHAIDVASRAGVGRIVYTSHMGASATSLFPPMHDHAATEALLTESGLRWVALRNGFYASALRMLLGDAGDTGEIEAPQDGKVAWTTHADLAAGAVRVLLDGGFEGPTPPLTAADALDLADVAGLLSERSNRAFRRRLISEEEQRARMLAAGIPEGAVDITLGLYRASAAGEFSRTDDALSELLGRTPATVWDVLDDLIDLGAPGAER